MPFDHDTFAEVRAAVQRTMYSHPITGKREQPRNSQTKQTSSHSKNTTPNTRAKSREESTAAA